MNPQYGRLRYTAVVIAAHAQRPSHVTCECRGQQRTHSSKLSTVSFNMILRLTVKCISRGASLLLSLFLVE